MQPAQVYFINQSGSFGVRSDDGVAASNYIVQIVKVTDVGFEVVWSAPQTNI